MQLSEEGMLMSKLLYRLFIILIVAVTMGGCSSPEEKAIEFYTKGQALLEKGEYDKANIEFRNALQLNKNLHEAIYGLALIAEKNNKWKDFYNLLTRVVELNDKHIDAQLKLGRILIVSDQLDRALQTSTRLLELAPNDPEVLSFHATVLLKSENYPGSIEFANRALKHDSKHIQSYVVLANERMANEDLVGALDFSNLGLNIQSDMISLLIIKAEVHRKEKNIDGMIKALTTLFDLRPSNKVFSESLVKAHLATGNHSDAELVLKDVVKRNGGKKRDVQNLITFINTSRGAEAAENELNNLIIEMPNRAELQFILVDLYLASGELKQAIDKLKDMSSGDLSKEIRLQAKVRLAALAVEQKEKEKALKIVDEILLEDPKNVQALLIKAADHINKKNWDKAVSILRSVLSDVPNSSPALRMLAQAFDFSGEKELAEDMYSKAFKASKHASDYGIVFAKFLLRQKKPDRAIAILEDSLVASPKNPSLLLALAKLHIAQKNWGKAKEFVDDLAQLAQGRGVSQQLLGIIFAGQQEYEKSIDSFKKAHELSPDLSKSVSLLVSAYIQLGRFDEAEYFLDTVISQNPKNDEALVIKAKLFLLQDKVEPAKQIYNDLIAKFPSNVSLYNELARLYLNNRQVEKALSVIDHGLVNVPGDVSLLMAKAGIYDGVGKVDKAIAVYEEVLKYKPDVAIALNNLASLLSEHRTDTASLQRAEELAAPFEKAEIPQFIDTLGWVYYKQGKYQKANELIAKAVEKAPRDIAMRYHLGMSYESLDDTDNARLQYEKILEIAGERDFSLRQNVLDGLKRISAKEEIKTAVNQ